MSSNGWKRIKLAEIIEINPKISLEKGMLAKKVSMEHIKEFTRKIQGYELATYSGGSKFQNGDTLMARITPCLENGKTAFVDILDQDEVGFGSTEFFVIRPKEGKADQKFVYYLSISDEIRNVAIQSMTGTSGRQRAQKDSLLNHVTNIPPLEIQEKIGKALSVFDDKIELNNQIISILEQLAQTLFKRWFVDFEFPNENGEPYKSSGGKMVQSELGEIPEGWQVGSLSTFIKDVISGDWGKDNPQKNYQIKVHVIRGTDIPEIRIGREGKVPIRYVLEKNFKKKFLLKGDVIIEISGGSPTQSTGRTLLIDDIILKKYDYKVICTNFCRAIRPKEPFFGVFIHLLLMKMYNDNLFFQLENGTTGIKNLDIINLLEKYPLILPSNKIIKLFADKFSVLLTKIQQKGLENKKLKEVRDTLLPKLLSGEIELPDESGVTEHVHVQ